MGMQNGTVLLKLGSYKTKHNLTTLLGNHAPWYLPKGVENFEIYTKMHMDVYSCLIHNYQNLKEVKMYFSQWMSK